jgi:hypothetical protein
MTRRRQSRWFLAAAPLGIGAGVWMPSCVVQEQPSSVSTIRQEVASNGIERTIPLRFVQMLQSPCVCGPTESNCSPTNCPTEPVSYETFRVGVALANDVFRPAGIQFYIKSVEKYGAPLLGDIDRSTQLTWAQVYPEFVKVWPALAATPNKYSTDPTRTDFTWLSKMAAYEGSPYEILVWVPQSNAGNAFNYGEQPWEGRMIYVHAPQLNTWTSGPGAYSLAHELGHFLGLTHTFAGPYSADLSTLGASPESGAPGSLLRSQYWDLVYKPGSSGSPHTYFTSRIGAIANEASLAAIDSSVATGNGYCANTYPLVYSPGDARNCCGNYDQQCSIVCSISSGGTTEVRFWDDVPGYDANIAGLGFRFIGDSTAAPNRGSNVMSYMRQGSINTAPRCGGSIGTSQIEAVRRYLRYDMPIQWTGAPVPSGARPLLGQMQPREPLDSLDFDQDGLRDFGFWDPPVDLTGTGSFRLVRTTSGNTSITAGVLGDIPVPGEYFYDVGAAHQKTDLALFRPGGGVSNNDAYSTAATWVLCNGLACGSPTSVSFGERGDIPFPNTNFDNDATTPELAVYRRSTRSFRWRLVSGGAEQVIQFSLGGLTAVVPMIGNYDEDTKTDVAIFEPSSGLFRVKLSSTGYSEISRTFAGAAPDASAPTTAGRDGSIPLGRMMKTYVGPPAYKGNALSIFNPDIHSFTVMWDWRTSLTTTTYSPTGSIGTNLSVPVSGIDVDNDGLGDMVVYTPNEYTTPGVVNFLRTSNGTGASTTLPAGYGRAIVFTGADRDGDGKPEIYVVAPDTMAWGYITSVSGYIGFNAGSAATGVSQRASVL